MSFSLRIVMATSTKNITILNKKYTSTYKEIKEWACGVFLIFQHNTNENR
jgi:hypothetical protein